MTETCFIWNMIHFRLIPYGGLHGWYLRKKNKRLKVWRFPYPKLKVERVSVASTVGVLTTIAVGLAGAIFLIALEIDPIYIN